MLWKLRNSRNKVRLKKGWLFTLIGLALVLGFYVAHPLYLGALGRFLVVSDPLAKTDAIIVLDGDYPEDERLLHAVELWRSGYASKMVLSAKLAEWQTYEDYPTWRHAMKLKVFPPDALFVASHDADSTKDEAQALLPFMRDHGFKTVIVVTSNYHTRRAKKVFQEEWAGSGIRAYISAAYSSQFHPDDWWRHRADSRTFFYEFSKTLWYALME